MAVQSSRYPLAQGRVAANNGSLPASATLRAPGASSDAIGQPREAFTGHRTTPPEWLRLPAFAALRQPELTLITPTEALGDENGVAPSSGGHPNSLINLLTRNISSTFLPGYAKASMAQWTKKRVKALSWSARWALGPGRISASRARREASASMRDGDGHPGAGGRRCWGDAATACTAGREQRSTAGFLLVSSNVDVALM